MPLGVIVENPTSNENANGGIMKRNLTFRYNFLFPSILNSAWLKNASHMNGHKKARKALQNPTITESGTYV